MLVIGEAIGTLLRCGEHGDHLAPRHVTRLFAELRAVERREICKVAVCDCTGAYALRLIAGVLPALLRFRRNPIADHLPAFRRGRIDDFGAKSQQLIKRVAEDRYNHVVFAKTLALGFKIIGGDVERFHQ